MITVAGVTYSTGQCRTEASAAAELAEALADGTAHWRDWSDELCTADNTAVAIEESAENARQWKQYLAQAEHEDREAAA